MAAAAIEPKKEPEAMSYPIDKKNNTVLPKMTAPMGTRVLGSKTLDQPNREPPPKDSGGITSMKPIGKSSTSWRGY
jgi:hypothetical protein